MAPVIETPEGVRYIGQVLIGPDEGVEVASDKMKMSIVVLDPNTNEQTQVYYHWTKFLYDGTLIREGWRVVYPVEAP